jgi:hypothetical protein
MKCPSVEVKVLARLGRLMNFNTLDSKSHIRFETVVELP